MQLRQAWMKSVAASTSSLTMLTLLGTVGAGSRPAASRWEFTEVHMGLPVRLVLHAASESDARAGARAAFGRIAVLDSALSDYRPDSELNRVSNRAGEWVSVSSDLFNVLSAAERMAEATGGAFDPTVGPLVALWRDARRSGRLPAGDAVAEARARVGWRRVQFDGDRRAVRLEVPGMRLDLGGIAKGFILDEARVALRAAGLTRVLIEAGGDIVAGAAPPGQRGWRIEVPDADAGFATRAAELVNAALATSGPTSQFVEIDGVRYSHVVDPVTGHGVTRAVVVHVIAPDGLTADALATAIGVIGLDCAAPVLERFPVVLASEVGEQVSECRAGPFWG